MASPTHKNKEQLPFSEEQTEYLQSLVSTSLAKALDESKEKEKRTTKQADVGDKHRGESSAGESHYIKKVHYKA